MLFLRSFELLPRPSLSWLAPHLGMLAVWFAFEGTDPAILGHPVLPIWLACLVQVMLTLARNAPTVLRRARAEGGAGPVAAAYMAILAIVLAGGLAVSPWIIQAGWLIGWTLYTLLFTGMLRLSPQDADWMPSRWAGQSPVAQSALWLVAVRTAVFVAVASWLMARGTLTDWVLFLTLGQVALFYLFGWFTILMALTAPDDEV